MPSGIGHDVNGYPTGGKHLSTGSEYPNSPCGSGEDLVSRVEEVTCLACLAAIIQNAERSLQRARKRLAEVTTPPAPKPPADDNPF